MRKAIAVLVMAIGLVLVGGVAHADYITNHGARWITAVNNSNHLVVFIPKMQVKRHDNGAGYQIRSVVGVRCYYKDASGQTHYATCHREYGQRLYRGNPPENYHQVGVDYTATGRAATVGVWKNLDPCKDWYITHAWFPYITVHGTTYGPPSDGLRSSNEYRPQDPHWC